MGDGAGGADHEPRHKMPAYRIRWRDSERPEIVLQHMLIADPDPTPPPDNVSLEPPAPKA